MEGRHQALPTACGTAGTCTASQWPQAAHLLWHLGGLDPIRALVISFSSATFYPRKDNRGMFKTLASKKKFDAEIYTTAACILTLGYRSRLRGGAELQQQRQGDEQERESTAAGANAAAAGTHQNWLGVGGQLRNAGSFFCRDGTSGGFCSF
ncbi:hypothetical protein Taro_040692 [Colocasia esculenta]|uniref:Uncharacterized protein n=1 Tax=Colocasia esculenta TaxID=4460 RepID=A0A843WV95_COLES|nr:hypothetical protein [Colocasia esculenta]